MEEKAHSRTTLELLAKLREPFEAHHFSKKPIPTRKQTEEVDNKSVRAVACNQCGGRHHPQAQHLDYVGHAAVTNRLLDVDPMWNWEPLALGPNGLPALDAEGGMWIRLTVAGVTRLGYGDAGQKKGPDAMKERIGDALRNAGMRFGMALELWHKGVLFMDADDEPEEHVAEKSAAARPERELCSDTKFATNEKAWRAVVETGKKTPDSLIAFLSTRLDFNEQQKSIIRGWAAKQQ